MGLFSHQNSTQFVAKEPGSYRRNGCDYKDRTDHILAGGFVELRKSLKSNF